VVRELALRDFSVLVQVVNLLINQKVDLASYAGSVCEGDHHLFLLCYLCYAIASAAPAGSAIMELALMKACLNDSVAAVLSSTVGT
jgi:hypothetical protein